EEVRDLECAEQLEKEVDGTDEVYTDVTPKDRTEIDDMYGASVFHVEPAVLDDSKEYAYVQDIIEMQFELNHTKIKELYDEMVAGDDRYRTIFYTSRQNHTYQIILKHSMSSVQLYDLCGEDMEKAMDTIRLSILADRRKSFRLDCAPHIRISIYQVHEDLNYVLLSMFVKGDSQDFRKEVIDYLFSDYISSEEIYSVKEEKNESEDEGRAFWKQYMVNEPKILPVPGYEATDKEYDKGLDCSLSTGEIYEKLLKAAKEMDVTVKDIFTTAWAILLYQFYKESDLMFGLAGNNSKLMPIRIAIGDETPIDKLVRQIHEKDQLVTRYDSRRYGRPVPAFDYILNINDSEYLEHVIESTDNSCSQRIKLTTFQDVYWNFSLQVRIINKKIALNCVYNKNAFREEGIGAILDSYMDILDKIGDDTKGKVKFMKEPFFKDITDIEEKKEISELQKLLVLRSIPLFEELPMSELKRIARKAEQVHCSEGDIICSQGEKVDIVPFVMRGHVEICKTDENGYVKPILLVGKRKLLTGEWMLANKESDFTMIAESNDTELLIFDVSVIEALLGKYPSMNRELFRIENERYRKMATLWVKRD
ncbi:MAG: cyclic nucleotide-binding domain-containing protein, partial [Clostridia bacterium]|nr:cyclic nucleotide-binding domain-containing protein [Clostridia bacterium]